MIVQPAAIVAVARRRCVLDPSSRPESGPQGREGQFIVECGLVALIVRRPDRPSRPLRREPPARLLRQHRDLGNIDLRTARSTRPRPVSNDSTLPPTGRRRCSTPTRCRSSRFWRRRTTAPVPGSTRPPSRRTLPTCACSAKTPRGRAGQVWRARPPHRRVPSTAGLRLAIKFPDCWDGERVDSADHRAHVASSSEGRCPDRHPIPIPLLELVIDYGDGRSGRSVAVVRTGVVRPR